MISDLFDTALDYESIVSNTNLLDFSKNREYGFVFNKKLYIPNKSFIKIDPSNNLLNFEKVNENFNKLYLNLKNHCIFGQISPNSKFHINNIKIEKSYINPEDVYKQYMLLLLGQFVLDKETNFLSFSEFSKKFIFEMKSNLFFLTDFIKTEAISIFSSGLAIQLFEETPNLETAKDYIQDEYFYIFKNMCLQYNFIIDKYMPWIIIYRVSDKYHFDNKEKYTDIYASDMSIFFSVLKFIYIYYVNNYLNKDMMGYVDITNYSLPKDFILSFYVEKKLEKNKINYSNKDFSLLLRYFKNNTAFNGISDSAHRLDNIKQNYNSIYNDR